MCKRRFVRSMATLDGFLKGTACSARYRFAMSAPVRRSRRCDAGSPPRANDGQDVPHRIARSLQSEVAERAELQPPGRTAQGPIRGEVALLPAGVHPEAKASNLVVPQPKKVAHRGLQTRSSAPGFGTSSLSSLHLAGHQRVTWNLSNPTARCNPLKGPGSPERCEFEEGARG